MGALTLGLILPAGPLADGHVRARSAELPWMGAERRSALDLAAAAEALGWSCKLIEVPVHSARSELDPVVVTQVLQRHCAGLDRVLIVAHGHLGGSGQLHALARACGLPVIGPSERAIALAYDKLAARRRLEHANVPVPRTVALDEPDNQPDSAGATSLERLGWPCVLKPRRGAAGAGVRRLTSVDGLRVAISQACRVDAELLLEREVVGRELAVVLVGGELLGIAELEREISDTGVTTHALVCPADLTRAQRAGLANLARRALAAVGLPLTGSSPVRVDLMVSERDNEVVLEVEALPPLERDGIVARVARAAGIPYVQLCAELLGDLPQASAEQYGHGSSATASVPA
jgi:D-alanine-D-alanine ligase